MPYKQSNSVSPIEPQGLWQQDDIQLVKEMSMIWKGLADCLFDHCSVKVNPFLPILPAGNLQCLLSLPSVSGNQRERPQNNDCCCSNRSTIRPGSGVSKPHNRRNSAPRITFQTIPFSSKDKRQPRLNKSTKFPGSLNMHHTPGLFGVCASDLIEHSFQQPGQISARTSSCLRLP